MAARGPAIRIYERILRHQLAGRPVPQHVALVMDGNRRWAREHGYTDVSVGHRFGAEHLETVLGWCAEAGVTHVTVFVASIDNLAKRDSHEVDGLMRLAEEVIAARVLRRDSPWRLHLAGRVDLLPDSTAHALKHAVDVTAEKQSHHLTLAIGYAGRAEVLEAIRAALEEAATTGARAADLAERFDTADIERHLWTSGLPPADLIIRTSGEQRLSDFLIWQAADAELYFCDVYWPGFRRIDLLRALRTYAARKAR